MDNNRSAGWLQALLFIGLSGYAALAHATVTYEGTDGVGANIFQGKTYSNTPASGSACADCHNSVYGQTPYLDTWSSVSSYGSPTTTGYYDGSCAYDGGGISITGFNYMARRVSCDQMPADGIGLTASGKSLFASWQSGGFLRWAAPSLSTSSASSVGKYSATLNGSINENGSDAATGSGYGAFFKYSTSAATVNADGGTSSTKSNPSGTGGGTSSTAYSRSVSGLSCGTTYYFRAHGQNAQGSASGSTQSFSTDACPSISEGSSITRNISEENTPTAFSLTLNASESVTWSISSAATNGSASVTGGAATSKAVTYTPDADYFGSDSFVVQISDGTTTDSITVTVNISNTQDAPSVSGGTVPATSSISEDVARAFDVDATDVDGDTLSYTLSTTPDISAELLSSNCSTGSYSTTTGAGCWIPDGTTSSVDFEMTVSDGNVSDDQVVSWTWTVTAVNDAPTFDEDPSTSAASEVDEDVTYSYDVQATDIDGDTLVYSLQTTPDISGDASYSFNTATGAFSWTPDQSRAGAVISVTAEVTDNVIASPISDSWTITVNPVNGAPSLSTVLEQGVTELSTLTLEMGSYVTDEDDDNANGDLTWSFIEPPVVPAGMSISNTAGSYGRLTWTPGQNTAGTYPIVVQVADSGADGAAPDTVSFDVVVTKLDTDGDTVADYDDNCPAVMNATQTNTDGDAFGDACDDDDDGDGISDAVETNNGLDPLDDTDAALDLDGDGLTNLEEAQTCADAGDTVTCEAISVDSVPPTITFTDVATDATGFYTVVLLEATAEDGNDGVVDAYITAIDGEAISLASGTDYDFRPGHHEVTWESQDSQGNTATEVQNVDVRPLVSLAGAKVSAEGQAASLTVSLNGESPSYPVTVNYTISGDVTAGDYNDGNAGVLSIADPDTEADIVLDIIADGTPEADETLTVTLTSVSAGGALAAQDSGVILITEDTLPPEVSLSLDQNGRQAFQVYQGDGNVTVTATPVYGSTGLTYDWSGSDVAIIGSGASVQFDPDALAVDSYTLAVDVFDGAVTVSQELAVSVVAALPVLTTADSDGDGIDDQTEGLDDADRDGIPDYLDAVSQVGVQQPAADENGADQTALIEVTPGLALRIGGNAVAASRSGARVTSVDIRDAFDQMLVDPDYTIIGGMFDFEVHGLNAANRTAQVVLPLPVTVPADAVFRKADALGWYTFSESAADALHSAYRVDGMCPAVASADWLPGLVQSSGCVRLTITDGGPNDADGTVNGVIRDPGGPAVANEGDDAPAVPVDTANESGVAGLWWLLMVLAGVAGRHALRRK
ncbi:MAG: Ig-like domain-containing protein [Alcanivoracaceae bacterium]|nr:Ig-like domain-containing protein [Alcanivoracaceae bacterium]